MIILASANGMAGWAAVLVPASVATATDAAANATMSTKGTGLRRRLFMEIPPFQVDHIVRTVAGAR
jgi:hypothetical protein